MDPHQALASRIGAVDPVDITGHRFFLFGLPLATLIDESLRENLINVLAPYTSMFLSSTDDLESLA